MKFEMIEQLNSDAGVEIKLACEVLKVSRSGYYAWKQRPISQQERGNLELTEKIVSIHGQSRRTYGSPRVHAKLKAEGVSCGKNRVARLMKENGIVSITRKRFRAQTTRSDHDLPIADRIFKVERACEIATTPNQVWVGDITYIPTEQGWVYLAVMLDVFTRKVVGFSIKDHMKTELVKEALAMALGRQPVGCDLVTHTDRGCQYASADYRELLKAHRITASMSRKGNCYDNAFAESFFHSLKTELVYQTKFHTKQNAMRAIFEYIEVFYNRDRLHSSLGYQTPSEYEEKTLCA